MSSFLYRSSVVRKLFNRSVPKHSSAYYAERKRAAIEAINKLQAKEERFEKREATFFGRLYNKLASLSLIEALFPLIVALVVAAVWYWGLRGI